MPHIPSRYHFRGQRENEEVLRVIHRHWFSILTHFFIILIFAFLLIASLLFLPLLFPEMLTIKNIPFFLFVENTFFIFLWIFGFLLWIDYTFDVWIITNERIVNIEQKGLFIRHISELNFSRVQDVTATVEGLIPSILNYGDVLVQTAGEEKRFIFRQVGNPYQIKDVVMSLSESALDNDLHKMAHSLSGKTFR